MPTYNAFHWSMRTGTQRRHLRPDSTVHAPQHAEGHSANRGDASKRWGIGKRGLFSACLSARISAAVVVVVVVIENFSVDKGSALTKRACR